MCNLNTAFGELSLTLHLYGVQDYNASERIVTTVHSDVVMTVPLAK